MSTTDTTTPQAPQDEPPDKKAVAEEQAQQGGEFLQEMAEPSLVLHGQPTPLVPGTDLAIIPAWKEMQGMASMAVTLAGANALPTALRNRPNDVFMVLLTARDLGVATTTALREFHVIEGKVTLSPKSKLAMLNERGEKMGWAVWPDPANNDMQATWHATRRDRPGVAFAFTFTWADAQIAGLADERCPTNNGQRHAQKCGCKDNWKKYPQRMVSWRALGYLLDDVFPEVGVGLYSPDELGAMTDPDGNPIDVKATEALPGMKNPVGHHPDRAGGGGDDTPPVASQEERDALQARINRLKDLSPDARAAVLELWAGTGEASEPLPPLHSLLARQLPRAKAIVKAVEDRAVKGEWGDWKPDADPETGEMATPPAEEDPQEPTTDTTLPPTPPEGGGEPDPADPAPEAATPPGVPTPEGETAPPPQEEDEVDRIIARVQVMEPAEVLAELVKRNLAAGGNTKTKQMRLAEALTTEWIATRDGEGPEDPAPEAR